MRAAGAGTVGARSGRRAGPDPLIVPIRSALVPPRPRWERGRRSGGGGGEGAWADGSCGDMFSAPQKPPRQGPMKIRHLVHSCLLVELAGRRLLVDPGGFSA